MPVEDAPPSLWQKILNQAPRFVLMWIFISYIANIMAGSTQDIPTTNTTAKFDKKNGIPKVLMPSFKLGTKMDLYFYLDQHSEFSAFDDLAKLALKEQNITFGDYNDLREREFKIKCDSMLQNNGSLYAHFYLIPAGTKLDSTTDLDNVIYHQKPLARLMPRKKVVQKKNLLNGAETLEAEVTDDKEWIRYWWPNVTLSIVANDKPITNLPPQIMQKFKTDKSKTKY